MNKCECMNCVYMKETPYNRLQPVWGAVPVDSAHLIWNRASDRGQQLDPNSRRIRTNVPRFWAYIAYKKYINILNDVN